MTNNEAQRLNQAEFKGVVVTKLSAIEGNIKEFKSAYNNHDTRINSIEITQTELKTKIGTFAILKSGLTVIAAAIAEFLGIRK